MERIKQHPAPARALALGTVALTIGFLVACDDTTFLVGGGEISGQGWCAVTALFDSDCTSCHSPGGGNLGDLDLETDPYAALVDAPSAYAGKTLVVPGDPGASFLLAKLEGTQAQGEGSPMPLSGPLPQSSIDIVSQWIADGASDVCEGTTPTVECDDTNETCAPGSCGGPEGPQMLPGADCLACHAVGGDPEAPRFTVGGTAFVDAQGTDTLAGAVVHITDANGATIDLTTNAVGNFYTAQAIAMPFSASIEVDGNIREMFTEQSTGACNSCHQCDGPAGGKLFGP